MARPAVGALVRELVEAAGTAPAVQRTSYEGTYGIVVHDGNADAARAFVWAAGETGADWVVPALHRLAVRGLADPAMSDKVPNACIHTLGSVGTEPAIAALRQLYDGTRHAGVRSRVDAALHHAAGVAGLTPGQLVERAVPAHGLDADGTVVLTAGGTAARLTLRDARTVAVEWAGAGGWVAKPPPDAPAAEVAAVKRQTKEVKDAVGAERRRVESLFADDRAWPVADWRRYYLDHPVTGRVARGLVWTIGDVTGIPGPDGLRTAGGAVVPVPAAGEVRLWHPARATVDEVAAWRSAVVADGLRQPFKQAFREVYLLTPAELATLTYSNRFAAHVLRYGQAYALFKERGWVANYLGGYDGGYAGEARRVFADAGLTAVFVHLNADDEQSPPEYCSTDRVYFHRTGDRARTPLPLADVPPLVFSEAMRDVDLFVGVTSLATDPTWADRGDAPHYAYWAGASFGELTPTAEVRRDALARLLPKLAIADRVSIDGRYVVVRGSRATYHVHIGSGNVLMQPSGRYLCIVPASAGRRSTVMLPFEGDGMLSVVLSKVVLLAADDKIKDRSILAQLP